MQEEDGGGSGGITRIVIYVGIRMMIVVTGLVFLYALTQIVQLIIGTGTITRVEEVVIVHEHSTEAEAAEARAKEEQRSRQKRRSGRSKKQKDQ